MSSGLQGIQWLFLDPSILLNEGDTDREIRRLVAAALSRRGRSISQDQVERAWMQAISAPRPVHPLAGAVQILVPDRAAAGAVVDEVTRAARNLDTLFPGVHLALGALQKKFKLGIIAAYRPQGTRTRLERFHLTGLPVVALSDEQSLSDSLDISGKPDPALFVWALRKAACPGSQAAYASDKVDLGLAPAKVAGMTTIWVRQTNYKLRYPRNSLETPDITVNSLGELPRLGE